MSEYIYETHGEQVIGNPKGFIFPKGEIVQCRDCKYYHPEMYNNINCEWFMFDVEPEGFCAWGVKCKESSA